MIFAQSKGKRAQGDNLRLAGSQSGLGGTAWT